MMKLLSNHKFIMLTIAFVQGLFLLLLHSDGASYSPSLAAYYTIAIGVPLITLLSIKKNVIKKSMVWALGLVFLFGFMGFYLESQLSGISRYNTSSHYVPYILMMIVAGFMLAMFMKQNLENTKISYSALFKFSWRNFLTIGLSFLFTLTFWGVLMLWAAIFEIINISFFYKLFTSEYFYYPVLSLCNGFGIIILRNQGKFIDALTRIHQALMKYLLLVMVLISIIFLCSLLFLGLEPLWKTGFGSSMLLWMQAIIIFMVNAAYQDGTGARPYRFYLHRYVYGGIALLPIYSLIISYGLFTRIAQYGWTEERSWGILIWAIFSLFSFLYLWAIIRKGDDWVYKIGSINTRMAFIVLFILLAINSPLLDLRKIAVSSQISRLESGKVSYEDFNYYYLKKTSAGIDALIKLQNEIENTHPDIYIKIDHVLNGEPYPEPSTHDTWKEFKARLVIVPNGEVLPNELLREMYRKLKTTSDSVYILTTDLNDDGQKDYLALAKYSEQYVFSFAEGKWQNHSLGYGNTYSDDFINALKNNDFTIIVPKWNDIKIGDETLKVRSN